MAKTSNNIKCKRYLDNKVRIRNKTRKLEKRIKTLKTEAQNQIKHDCRIGRKKEGFAIEKFKFLPSKKDRK